MKRVVGWISAIFAVGFVFTVVGCSNKVSMAEYNLETEYDDLDNQSDLETNDDYDNPDAEYELVSEYINGIAWVERKYNYYLYQQDSNNYGMVDEEGNFVVPPIYEHVASFGYYTRGSTWVILAETQKWGLIDTESISTAGRIVVPFLYDSLGWSNIDGWAEVERDGKQGLLDRAGNVLVPVEYEHVFYYHDGIAAVMLDGKWGFIDSDNNVIIPFKYDYITPCSNGLFRVVISDNGNAYNPYTYQAPEMVWLKGKFGFVDRSGNVMIPIVYDYADCFDNDGLASVKLDGRTGMIDISGEIVVPLS